MFFMCVQLVSKTSAVQQRSQGSHKVATNDDECEKNQENVAEIQFVARATVLSIEWCL